MGSEQRPKCGCPDRNDAQHCLLLQDFPGGFYGDMEASRDEECECSCHKERDERERDEDEAEEAEREQSDSDHAGELCGPDCGYCGRCS